MAISSAPSENLISIAIIGAGISSLCLARGLLKYKNITLRIYEGRAEIGSDGSGFGIGGNAQRALRLLDPELFNCLERAGAVENVPHVRFMMATGPDSGKRIADVHSEPAERTVRRSRMLTEIRNLLPNGVVEASKRLLSMEERPVESKKVRLVFEDGLDVNVDAVVGGDGINSVVRRHVLGPDNPATEPVWTPGFNTRIVIPMDEAVAIFGAEYCNIKTQVGWIGQEGFCLTDTEDDGNVMQVIAGFSGPNTVPEVYGKPFAAVEKVFWTSRLREWGWIGEKVSQTIEKQETVFVVSGRYHGKTPTYCSGHMCVIGDAANCFSPFLGAGAGQGIEDALILSSVLGCANGAREIEKALRIHDSLRRQRRENVAERSKQEAILLTGRAKGIGTDVDKLAKAVKGRYDFLNNYHLEPAVDEAERLMSCRYA